MNNTDYYKIKVRDFEGPFDLLLFFIERQELSIYDVSISKITDDFLDYIHQLLELDIQLSSEFMYMAARLMKIKAHSLLPVHKSQENEEEEISEEQLIKKIVEYKKFKKIGEFFSQKEDDKFLSQSRGNRGEELKSYAEKKNKEAESYSLPNMYMLFRIYKSLVVKNTTESIDNYETQPLPYTVEEQKAFILEMIHLRKRIQCLDILKASKDRLQFVINFLAILDLIQEKVLRIQVMAGYNNFTLTPRSSLS